LRLWTDQKIQPGDLWKKEIGEALERAKLAVLLISPHFFASKFIIEQELPYLLERAKEGSVRILWIPVSDSSYRQTAVEPHQALWSPDKPLGKLTKPKRNSALVQICEKIHGIAQPSVSVSDAAPSREETERRSAARNNLPFASLGNLFKGRDADIVRLRDTLSSQGTVAITPLRAVYGMGGIGKTRLGLEYAWRSLQDGTYEAAFFVRGDTASSLQTHISGLAAEELLDLPEKDERDQNVIVHAVMNALRSSNKWLLIVDNVDSTDTREHVLKDFGTFTSGHVLVTSRLSEWPDGVASEEIEILDADSAASYLLTKMDGKRASDPEDEGLAQELAEMLGYLPLALEQAGAYITHLRIGFRRYQEQFKESREKVLGWRAGDLINYPVEILSTWATTEKHLGPVERAILRLACFLAPDPIPTEMFEEYEEMVREAAEALAAGKSPLNPPLSKGGKEGISKEVGGENTAEGRCATMEEEDNSSPALRAASPRGRGVRNPLPLGEGRGEGRFRE